MQRRPLPYNTGKVLIGSHYEPPQPDYMTREGYALQRALLKPGRPVRKTDPGLILWAATAVLATATIAIL
jgi:hypothetical protein